MHGKSYRDLTAAVENSDVSHGATTNLDIAWSYPQDQHRAHSNDHPLSMRLDRGARVYPESN